MPRVAPAESHWLLQGLLPARLAIDSKPTHTVLLLGSCLHLDPRKLRDGVGPGMSALLAWHRLAVVTYFYLSCKWEK